MSNVFLISFGITIRLPHNEKEKLAQIAQGENISLNKLIIRCIDFALKNR